MVYICNPHHLSMHCISYIISLCIANPLSFQYIYSVLYHFIMITSIFNNKYLLFFTYCALGAMLGAS